MFKFYGHREHGEKQRCDKRNQVIKIKEKEIEIFFQGWIILENLNFATNPKCTKSVCMWDQKCNNSG